MFLRVIWLAVLVGCSAMVEKDSKPRTVPLFPGHSLAQHEASSNGVMITSQGNVSSQAGLEMFRQGGNIIDAAVAVSFAISVERPQSTGIGGGGFLIFYNNKTKRSYVWDFRERAPGKSKANMYLKPDGSPDPQRSIDGPLAVGVPGLVQGLWDIHQRYGKLPWAKVVAPAIKLAQEGFPVYPHLVEAIKDREAILKQDPEATRTFFMPDGSVPHVGYLLLQPELAETLRTIAAKGARGFYHGRVAQKIVDSITKRGGIMTLSDLSGYQTKTRQAVEGTYRGYKIISMPPPSSGGTHVIEILNLLEKQNLRQYGPQSSESIHRIATAMQIAFADRAKYMGDPDFVSVPVKQLTSKEYAAHMQQYFTAKAMPSRTFPLEKLPDGPSHTTHFTLADREQNVVVSTQTINDYFGSAMMAQGAGIVLNNEMDDFAQKVGASNLFGAIGGDKNLVAPRKRPLSSMSPTIVLKDDRPVLALGTPSGTRIITCVTQTILNVLEFKLPLYESVAGIRVHHQWQPEELRVEEPFLEDSVMKDLEKRGHKISRQGLGCQVQAVQRLGESWLGVSDPRGEGLAIGE